MKNLLLHKVRPFFVQWCKGQNAIVIAFSGGPDSLALLHLLLKSGALPSEAIHLVHVDHGWRAESHAQAESLERYARNLKLSFHCKRLDKNTFTSGNMEDRARQERYRFFQDVASNVGANIIFTGHQKDDQAETVLKRVLEGSSFFSLDGIKSYKRCGSITLVRPLLPFSKKELVSWLHEQGLHDYIVDHTNHDVKFLRGRMRQEILPYLNDTFGKHVADSLIFLSKQVKDISSGLEEYFKIVAEKALNGRLATFIDRKILEGLSGLLPLFLRYFFASYSKAPSRQVIDSICLAITLEKKEQTFFQIDRCKVFVDLRGLLIFNPFFDETKIVTHTLKGLKGYSTSWRDLLEGELYIPMLDVSQSLIFPAQIKDASFRSALYKKYSSLQVPTALRPLLPALLQKDGGYLDCLTVMKKVALKTNIDFICKINYLK